MEEEEEEEERGGTVITPRWYGTKSPFFNLKYIFSF